MIIDQKFLPYIDATSALRCDYSKKTKLIAMAVAAAIAYSVPLPTTEVSDVCSFFRGKYAYGARNLAMRFNENAVLDKQLTYAMIDKFYSLRYNSLFRVAPTIGGECFFDSFLGVDRFFSKEEMDFLDENSQDVTNIIFIAEQIIKQLVVEETQLGTDIASRPVSE